MSEMRDGWTKRTVRYGRRVAGDGYFATEYRRPIGTMFELLVEDDPADGIDWLVCMEGNAIAIGRAARHSRGPLAWLIREAMKECEEAARKAGLNVPGTSP